MRRFSLILATAALAGSAAGAQDYSALARELYNEGFQNQARISLRSDTIRVTATGTAGRTERIYTRDGSVLLKEETLTADGVEIERSFSRAGALLKEEVERTGGRSADHDFEDHGRSGGADRDDDDDDDQGEDDDDDDDDQGEDDDSDDDDDDDSDDDEDDDD